MKLTYLVFMTSFRSEQSTYQHYNLLRPMSTTKIYGMYHRWLNYPTHHHSTCVEYWKVKTINQPVE